MKRIVVLLVLAFIVSATASQMEILHVDPLTMLTFTVNMNAGDSFVGSLSISGGSGNDVDFWIKNPSGDTIADLGRVHEGTSFEFSAARSGAYSLNFDNSFSLLSSKSVTLSYDIHAANPLQNPATILGIIIVVLVILGVLLGWAITNAYHAYQKQQKQSPPPP